MSCLLRLKWSTLDEFNSMAPPGTTGWGDIGSARTGTSGPSTANSYFDTNHRDLTNPSARTIKTLRSIDTALDNVDYHRFYADIEDTSHVHTGPWSMRLYYCRSTHSTTNFPVARFHNASGDTVYIYMTATSSTSARIRTASANLSAALNPSNGVYRIEIQADPNRSPNMVCRVYAEDGTTVLGSWTMDTAGYTEWDYFDIGHFISGNLSASALHYGDLEVHDDYDLGGQFTSNPSSPTAASTSATGAPSVNQTFDSRFHVTSNRTVQEVALTESVDFTKYTDVSYTTAGTYGRVLDLYVPTGTPPTDGWPLYMYAHSGFFTDGTKSELPATLRDDLLHNGIAVASLNYVLSSINAVSYPSYGTGQAGGRYPSHIIDYKRACAFLRDNAATYDLDPAKFVAGGYSAGGYLGLAAVITRGLHADDDGTPLSLVASASNGDPWADGYSGSDPVFCGALVMAAPVDMDAAVAWDPTSPNSGRVLSISSRAFQGLLQTGTNAPSKPAAALQNLAALNASNIDCPVRYIRGTADYLVHWEHEELLAAALDGVTDYEAMVTPGHHHRAHDIYDRDEILDYLLEITAGDTPPVDAIELTWWDGSGETAAELLDWDGAVETPAELEIVP